MPVVSQEYIEARRQTILDAAEAVFARDGVHGATLRDIRTEAEVSSGALYHYFKSKDDIIAAIRDRALALDIGAYEEARQEATAKEALVGLVEAGMAINHGSTGNVDARLAVMLWSEALINDRVLDTQMRLMDPWWTIIGELSDRAVQERDLSPDVDTEALAVVLAALSLGATVIETWQPRRLSQERLTATARALLLGELWEHSTGDSI